MLTNKCSQSCAIDSYGPPLVVTKLPLAVGHDVKKHPKLNKVFRIWLCIGEGTTLSRKQV